MVQLSILPFDFFLFFKTCTFETQTGAANLSQAKLMCSAKCADAALSWSVSGLQGPARADAALPHCADRRRDVVLRDAALPPRQAGHQGRERLGRDAPGAAAATAAAGGKLFISCSSSVMCSVLSVCSSPHSSLSHLLHPSIPPSHPSITCGRTHNLQVSQGITHPQSSCPLGGNLLINLSVWGLSV